MISKDTDLVLWTFKYVFKITSSRFFYLRQVEWLELELLMEFPYSLRLTSLECDANGLFYSQQWFQFEEWLQQKDNHVESLRHDHIQTLAGLLSNSD